MSDEPEHETLLKIVPAHEQRILEAHIRGVPLSLLALQEEPLNEYEQRDLKNLIRLRVRGFPLQYLIGTQSFYGRDFYVNTGVLIPRPETEGLVELALKELKTPEQGVRLLGLDVGTGSACIALTLAMERGDLMMHASECSNEAYAVAQENASRHRVANVELHQVSAEPQLWQYDQIAELDLIISNPPYLVQADEVATDVREHEPHEALFVPDDDAMFFYLFLAELAHRKLKSDGVVVLEIAEQRAVETAEVFKKTGFETRSGKDLTGRDRYIVARKKN